MPKTGPEFRFPGPDPKEAKRFFRAKGWAVGFDYRDVWREEHAIAFTIAKATEADVLVMIRKEVDRAIAEGVPFRKFQKELTPRLQRAGWWGKKEMTDPLTGERVTAQLGSPRRLRTIYDANLRTARAAGAWERTQRTKKALPNLLYQLGPSRKHREEHADWAGKILPADDPWWRTHYPPNGWGCKCWTRQISARETKRRGGLSERPPVRMRNWVNKRTGEVTKVPEGIDPGWDTNPGAAQRRKAATERLREANQRADGVLRGRVERVKGTEDDPIEMSWSDSITDNDGYAREAGHAVDSDVLNSVARSQPQGVRDFHGTRFAGYGKRARDFDAPTAEDVVIERDMEQALQPAKRNLTLFRGMHFEEADLKSFLRNLDLTGETTFRHFTSTTTQASRAVQFAQSRATRKHVLLVVRQLRGHKGVMRNMIEREVTQPTGARYRVVRITENAVVKTTPAGEYYQRETLLPAVVEVERIQ